MTPPPPLAAPKETDCFSEPWTVQSEKEEEEEDDDDDDDDDDDNLQTSTTKDSKGPQTNMPNVGSMKT